MSSKDSVTYSNTVFTKHSQSAQMLPLTAQVTILQQDARGGGTHFHKPESWGVSVNYRRVFSPGYSSLLLADEAVIGLRDWSRLKINENTQQTTEGPDQ